MLRLPVLRRDIGIVLCRCCATGIQVLCVERDRLRVGDNPPGFAQTLSQTCSNRKIVSLRPLLPRLTPGLLTRTIRCLGGKTRLPNFCFHLETLAAMSDDEFGSDDWGDVDEEALIAAANQVEQEQEITSSNSSVPVSRPPPPASLPVAFVRQRQGTPAAGGTSDTPLFLDDDFDNSDDEFRDPPRVIRAAPAARSSLVRSSSGSFRQSTLFGGVAEEDGSQPSSTPVQRSWPLVNTQEPPTHHKIDREAAKTWIYPANVPHRDYQYSIVSRALFSNVLVALPTGLSPHPAASRVFPALGRTDWLDHSRSW